MPFACQKDSYLTKLHTSVKSCEAATLQTKENGKKVTISGYNALLEDTVLFPEGGGQPDDRGTINGQEVLRVARHGGEAIHFLRDILAPGCEVEVLVDWTRRFDHMQQHTGQHLITAIAESLFGFKTTSWNLGETTSFIELATPSISHDQLERIESRVNEEIRRAIEVKVHVYDSKEDPELTQFRCRGLPSDHTGPVRVIQIGDLDCNLCCGTHVSNLAHLQIVKLLHTEKGKKNATNLHFVVGDRVNAYLGRCVAVETSLNTILSGPLDQHAELADKMLKSFKLNKKINQHLLREIATKDVALYKITPDPDCLLSIHRKDGEMDFINAVVNEVADETVSIFITLGEISGMFFIRAPQSVLKEIESSVLESFEAKGAAKNGRFQGKANKLSHRTDVEQCIRSALTKQQ